MFNVFRKAPEEKTEDQARIQASLTKTRQGFFGRIGALFQANEITDTTWEELEELLIQADVGINTAMGVVERVRERVRRENIRRDGCQGGSPARTAAIACPPGAHHDR